MGRTNRFSLVHCSCFLQTRRLWRRGGKGEELWASCLSVPLETGPAGPTNPSPTHPHSPPLQFSHGGNAGRGLWIIGNFNPLKAIIQNETFQIYFASSAESSCLFQACTLVLEASCHASRPHIQPLICPFALCFVSFNTAQTHRGTISTLETEDDAV